MREVGVLEAKTSLSALLAEVEKTGESVAITRHGRRIARISPEPGRGRDWTTVADELIRRADALAACNPAFAEAYDLRADRDAIE